jgi:hypothetical protein
LKRQRWEGFQNRDKSEDLPDKTKRSKLSGRKALDHSMIPPLILLIACMQIVIDINVAIIQPVMEMNIKVKV